ncbi:gfo/Idh/MocA family oxidoreductase [Oceanobacillus arenosus]|uniref:Gfo/Idh/MocA family oxidoreductase n=1 Tax=Oceanobacillus arenosus TaxID=1229153 RepID=A0A3D8PZ38_9BACI|nr:Gfo/Idh/MocA family oxidoreductase [Oceanobacillus arenosus]RDW21426.1 gfo/Idh/MocA family oxidoreductase [Oceanobacillus arenosus]
MLNTLVIGAGTMGSTHAAAYVKMEDVTLVGIVDTNLAKARDLAEKLGTKAFQTYEEAVGNLMSIDVVSVCVPTPVHKEYVMKAADENRHVICEKPLARSLSDARDMIHYCQDKGVKLFVGHVVRFFPEYVRAKQVVDEGKIGNPAVIRTTRGGGFPIASNDWYSDFNSSGGLVLDMIIHDFDFLRWCFGEVERVYAKSSRTRVFEKLEYALVTLRFESGAIAHVEGTWAHQGFSTRFEIAGKEGIIEYDSAKVAPVVASKKESVSSGGVAVPESPMKNNPYFTELQHFINCINTDTKPIVSAEDAYKAMEISLAALESIETGKAVVLQGTMEKEAVQ